MKQKNLLFLVALLFCGFGITNLQAQRDITLGAVAAFSPGGASYSKTDAIDATHFLVVYKDAADSDAIKIRVGEVNPSTSVITYGTAATVEASANRYPYVTVLSATKAVVTYELDIATDEANSRIIEFNTATNAITTVNAATSFANDYHSSGFHSPVSIVKLTSTTFAYLYINNSSKNGAMRIGTADGSDSISYGAEYEFESGVAKFAWATRLADNKIVIGYEDDRGASDYGNLLVASVAGTVVSFGDVTIFKDPIKNVTVQRMNDSQFVVAYADDPSGSASDFGFAKVGTVTGTDIVVSTAAYTFENTERVTDVTIGQLSANEFVVGYSPGATRNSNVVTGKIAGTGASASIVFGSAIEVAALEARGNFLAVLDNSTFVITYDNRTGANLGESRVGTLSKNTWLGTSTVWANTANWSLGTIPVASDLVVVPNIATKPIIGSGTNALANIIEVETGSTLDLNGGGTLTIDGSLSQNGTFTINSDATSNGSLILKGTSAGNVTYERYLSTSATESEGWHLVSSPVNGQDIAGFFGSVLAKGTKRAVAPYINTNGATLKWQYYTTGDTPGDFLDAKGYTIKKTTAGTLAFNGELNTASVDISVANTGDQFNAIGNPFTSYINSGTFLTNVEAGRLTEKTIWLWDEAANAGAGDYITRNEGAAYEVAPGQAFFVKALATGDVTFSEDLQIHTGGNSFLKQESKPEIKISITDGKNIKNTDILYFDNKTTGFDNGYDSSMFEGISNPFAVYTQLISDNQGQNLAIQSLPNSSLENEIIPIGINAISGKEITFSLDALNLPNGIKVYLEDRVANTLTRLDEANSSYKIKINSDLNGIGRFYLKTAQKSLSTNSVELENISIYKKDEATLTIVGLQQGEATVKLFNILGKQVLNTRFNSNGVQDIILPKIATGVYVVQINSDAGKLNKKIILE